MAAALPDDEGGWHAAVLAGEAVRGAAFAPRVVLRGGRESVRARLLVVVAAPLAPLATVLPAGSPDDDAIRRTTATPDAAAAATAATSATRRRLGALILPGAAATTGTTLAALSSATGDQGGAGEAVWLEGGSTRDSDVDGDDGVGDEDGAEAVVVVRVPHVGAVPADRGVAWSRALLSAVRAERVVILDAAVAARFEADDDAGSFDSDVRVAHLATRAFVAAVAATEAGTTGENGVDLEALCAVAPPLRQATVLEGAGAALLAACEARSIPACSLLLLTRHAGASLAGLPVLDTLDTALATVGASNAVALGSRRQQSHPAAAAPATAAAATAAVGIAAAMGGPVADARAVYT